VLLPEERSSFVLLPEKKIIQIKAKKKVLVLVFLFHPKVKISDFLKTFDSF